MSTSSEEEISAIAEAVQSDTALLSLDQITAIWLDEMSLNSSVRNNFYGLLPEKDKFPPEGVLQDTPPGYSAWHLLHKRNQQNTACVSPTEGVQRMDTRNTAQSCEVIIFSLDGIDSTLPISDDIQVRTFGDIFQKDHDMLTGMREELKWSEAEWYSYSIKGETKDFAFPEQSRFFQVHIDAMNRIKTVMDPMQVNISRTNEF